MRLAKESRKRDCWTRSWRERVKRQRWMRRRTPETLPRAWCMRWTSWSAKNIARRTGSDLGFLSTYDSSVPSPLNFYLKFNIFWFDNKVCEWMKLPLCHFVEFVFVFVVFVVFVSAPSKSQWISFPPKSNLTRASQETCQRIICTKSPVTAQAFATIIKMKNLVWEISKLKAQASSIFFFFFQLNALASLEDLWKNIP